MAFHSNVRGWQVGVDVHGWQVGADSSDYERLPRRPFRETGGLYVSYVMPHISICPIPAVSIRCHSAFGVGQSKCDQVCGQH